MNHTETRLESEAEWLESPVTERAGRLKPMRDLELEPHFGRGRRLKLFQKRYLIGSAAACDIRLRDPFVSPRHAELVIRREGEGYEIVDLGSRNGVFLNGVRVSQAPLPARGSLRIGRSVLSWRDEEEDIAGGSGWVVADRAMVEIVTGLRRVAKTGLPVLLLGDTGTGKEILAKLIHDSSDRRLGRYVTVNGALIGGDLAESELFGHRKGAFTGAQSHRSGALRSAQGGTLFLDEVADIAPAAQVKLLRALETGEVKPLGSDVAEKADFRLVTATSQPIEERIEEGTFRLDLYYRLAGYVVHVPALRDRPQDILAISRHLLEQSGMELDRECEGRLLSYRWPGNVRELKALLTRAMLAAREENSGRVLPRHIEMERGMAEVARRNRSRTLAEVERDHVRSALERHGWKRGRTARELGIARSTLFAMMKRHEIQDRA